MSDLGDLDELLADLGGKNDREEKKPKEREMEKSLPPSGKAGDIAARLAELQKQGDMMKHLLDSDEDAAEHEQEEAQDPEATDLDKLLGDASRMLARGDAPSSAYGDEDVESSPPSSPVSTNPSEQSGRDLEPARLELSQKAGEQESRVQGPADAALSHATSSPATSSPPSSVVSSAAACSRPNPPDESKDASEQPQPCDHYEDEFESECEDTSNIDPGVSIHQMGAAASAPGEDGEDDGDGYGDEEFDADEDVASVGSVAERADRAAHDLQDADIHTATEGGTTFVKHGTCAVCGQCGQCMIFEPHYCHRCALKSFNDNLSKGDLREAAAASYHIERLAKAESQHGNQRGPSRPTRVDPSMIKQQLSMLQGDWMKEGSMQQRIYRVAAQQLAKSILMDIFNECIDSANARRRKEMAFEAERRRRDEAGFHQPRTCDIRVAEKKKKKQEGNKNIDAERARRDAEYSELAREKAEKRAAEIKGSEAHLAESKERFRRKREKNLKKFEENKQALLQSNRQRVMEVKKQSEQNKQDLADFIQGQREEEAKARYREKKEQEEREAYRQYQQEVAVASMRAFVSRQRDSKNDTLAKSKDDLRAIKRAHQVFEGSLRRTELHMEKIAAPRAESKKRRLGSYVKDVLSIDSFQTGKAYTDALKLTSAIYFSPCESGSLLPQTKKQVRALTVTTLGPTNGKRQIKASQVIATLQEAHLKFERWRPNGVKSTDLVAVLGRFKLGAPASQIERLVAEFGIEPDDCLAVDDFVETGVAIFTIVAPDVLVMGTDGHRRSKSAEPLPGKQMLLDLERSCVSSLGHNSGISFTKSAAVKDDLTLHLAGSLKSRKAREREMAMLAQEAMEIKKLREARQAQEASSRAESSTLEETPKRGLVSFAKGIKAGSVSPQPRPAAVGSSDSPAPSSVFNPSPAPGLAGNTHGQDHASRSTQGVSPDNFAGHPAATLVASRKGGAFCTALQSAASKPSTISPATPQPATQTELQPQLARPSTGTTSRPVTRGSRPSSRQTPIPTETIPTETLEASLPRVREGLQPLPTSNAPGPQIDTTGLSRVQRMKLLQQQNSAASGSTPGVTGGAGGVGGSLAAPAAPLPSASQELHKEHASSSQECGQAAPVPVPVSEPSIFPRRARGNRPF